MKIIYGAVIVIILGLIFPQFGSMIGAFALGVFVGYLITG